MICVSTTMCLAVKNYEKEISARDSEDLKIELYSADVSTQFW